MEVSPLDSFNHLFSEKPYTFFSPKIKLVKDDIYEIYQKSNCFTKTLEQFQISNEKYTINYEGEDDVIKIKFYQNNSLIECQKNIWKTPYKIEFKNIDEYEEKNLYIFKKEAYIKLILYLEDKKNKYEFIEDQHKRTLLIKNKTFKISDEIFKATIEKNNNLNEFEDFKAKTITLNLKFTSNFETIFIENQKNKDFIFMLNKEII